MDREKWHRRYLELGNLVASWSKDESMKVGAVIFHPGTKTILSVGYNGLPRGMDDNKPEYHERPGKYFYYEHAERNAIFNSTTNLAGMAIVVTWVPCADCARAIVQTGIREVIYPCPQLTPEQEQRWKDQMFAARHILEAAGVRVTVIQSQETKENTNA